MARVLAAAALMPFDGSPGAVATRCSSYLPSVWTRGKSHGHRVTWPPAPGVGGTRQDPSVDSGRDLGTLPDQAPGRAGGIGALQGTALTLGALLGTGVISLPALAAEAAGPASLLAWGALILVSVAFAATFAALGSRFPDGGGVTTYVRRAFGDRASTAVGWAFFFTIPDRRADGGGVRGPLCRRRAGSGAGHRTAGHRADPGDGDGGELVRHRGVGSHPARDRRRARHPARGGDRARPATRADRQPHAVRPARRRRGGRGRGDPAVGVRGLGDHGVALGPLPLAAARHRARGARLPDRGARSSMSGSRSAPSPCSGPTQARRRSPTCW